MGNQQQFQVNLQGMIDLLSNHLYSNPGVFIREALQNAVDAITARKRLSHLFEERITVELFASGTITIQDNGIGLTEDEIHQYLSQIGSSAKRKEQDLADDFIGQFGVGLLSCFVVSDEIVLITRSALEGDALEWRGKPDGTYGVRKLQSHVSVGTTLYLTCKPGYEEFFDHSRLEELLEHYGAFLPVPVYFANGKSEERINHAVPPWRMDKEEALAYGKRHLYELFLDVIPFRSVIGEVEGVAYVLPYAVSLQAEKKHRVYLKNMLLSDSMEKIVPPWAFFVTCMLNTNGLRPTASREAFYENDLLASVQEEVGVAIKRYLIKLAEHDPELFAKIMMIHYASIKALAVEDDELYRLFIPYLSFETSMGSLRTEQFLARNGELFVTATLDEFRQVARVAKAQDMLVINGGYSHDFELIRKLRFHYKDHKVTVLDPLAFSRQFKDLGQEDKKQADLFLRLSDRVLAPFQCQTAIKWFEPADIPVLYTTNEEVGFLRMAEKSKDGINELFTGIVDMVIGELYEKPLAQLCFNYNNPMIRKAVACGDPELQQLCIEMFYTQSLLMGNYPMNQEELKLMNQSFTGFLNLGLDRAGEGGA